MNFHDIFIQNLETTTFYKPIPYFNLEAVQWSLLFGVCFLLGLGMGGNDVADAFGTSVGTGTVTVTQAFVLATVVEMMGAVASGLSVENGNSLLIVETTIYADNPDELVLGQIAMLVGSSAWLFIATWYCMPVSSIHSILGATIGFSLVLRGFEGIVWQRLAFIVAIWILSPLFSAISTLIVFFLIDFFILRRKNPLKTGFHWLPFIYFIVFFTNILLLLQDGNRDKKFAVLRINNLSLTQTVLISLLIGLLSAFLALFFVVPYMKKRIEKNSEELPRIASSLSYSFPIQPRGWVRRIIDWLYPTRRNDDQKVVRLFPFLQLMTACFAGFAHGADDVVNCIFPIVDLVQMYNQDSQNLSNSRLNMSIYIGLLSTLAVLLGIWTLGIRVMKTISYGFMKMNPATGFSVEFGSAIVMLATNAFDIPQSMTHCLVGSIFGLGLVRSGPILQWKTVKYVIISWILTVPVSGLISAATMYSLRHFLTNSDIF